MRNNLSFPSQEEQLLTMAAELCAIYLLLLMGGVMVCSACASMQL